jgi:hypothetical protein
VTYDDEDPGPRFETDKDIVSVTFVDLRSAIFFSYIATTKLGKTEQLK